MPRRAPEADLTAIIRAVTPLLFVAAGAIALLAGVVTLRSIGPRFRIGRLLASTPRVSVAEAREIARSGAARYVRIDGRVDAEDEFEDANHRPLVFRRTRFAAFAGRRWSDFEDSREAVPFEIRDGLDAIAVDHAALDAGLVVVRRESEGAAGDLGDRAPAGLAPEMPVRVVVEQVSSVDQATVLGVPTATAGQDGDHGFALTAGLGRPLVLTTLATDEAMRVLAAGSARPRIAAVGLAFGAGLIAVGLVWAGLAAVLPAVVSIVVPVARAASPGAEATPATGGDPRSSGEGPGLVGEPAIAIIAVVAIAVVAIILTTAWIRWTAPRDDGPRERR
jgi:hypothetical protein